MRAKQMCCKFEKKMQKIYAKIANNNNTESSFYEAIKKIIESINYNKS